MMIENKWQSEIYEKLERAKENLDPRDFRFYNIAHFPLLAKFTEEHAAKCEQCSENINLINNIVNSLPDSLNAAPVDRSEFERRKTNVENHLKKIHHMRFPGYYTALFTLIGILGSFILSLFINLLIGGDILSDLTIITLTFGLIAGISVGKLRDKSIFAKNLQL